MISSGPRSILLGLALALAACSDPAETGAPITPVECDAVAPTECVSPAPTWADVEPVIMERCVSCHGNEPGLWPLDDYAHVVDWSVEVRGMVLDCSMPPPDSGVQMTTDERQLILQWLRCGNPR